LANFALIHVLIGILMILMYVSLALLDVIAVQEPQVVTHVLMDFKKSMEYVNVWLLFLL
jgi:hypothetical protein